MEIPWAKEPKGKKRQRCVLLLSYLLWLDLQLVTALSGVGAQLRRLCPEDWD